ncbi:DUF523 and DUF1722 domain-containing protein [Victivallis sp. Marseille-Q1083]|uniref:DUF523 and DUF1722 domain-containing protein n=1 Tax=Victivallis sp. Marseille-Q1083 TaxID=2717288 RepID=UPI00158AC601|nr:DUF523 and DUF1722 domain-containing protein [Victivallis sp. Marseille-Q1083]
MIKLGISSCLLGQRVRYDGGHKLDYFLRDGLKDRVEWVPVCPETECGLAVPREPMHLVADASGYRLRTVDSQRDYTELMRHYINRRVTQLSQSGLYGYVFKGKSPSCGLREVPCYRPDGEAAGVAGGLFAEAVRRALPLLPVIDDASIHNVWLRETFGNQILTLRRWHQFVAADGSAAGLAEFNRRHRLLIMLHSPGMTPLLSYLVLHATSDKLTATCEQYFRTLMAVMATPVSLRKHQKVLFFVFEELKNHLDNWERLELQNMLHHLPEQPDTRSAVAALLLHYIRKFRLADWLDQYYFQGGEQIFSPQS